MNTQPKESPTAVIFRKWRPSERIGCGDNIIALFPEIPTDDYDYACLSYEHVGQHGGANYLGCIKRTRPAKSEEYADLKKELEGLNYTLKVYQKETPQHRKAFQAEQRRLRQSIQGANPK